MHRLTSSIQKRLAPTQFTRLDNTEPEDPEAWKARLAAELPSPLDRSQFEKLIGDYLSENEKPDLSFLVCECMKHGNVDVLTYILANEDIKSLYIEGPLSATAWKALAKSMPAALHAMELTVSKDHFDAYKRKQLFRVLKHMPALQKVSLRKVTEEGGPLFDLLECPDLPTLADLAVFAKSDPKAGGFRLPLKILRACKVQRLSIEESEAISIDKHSKLASLLHEQSLLDSLRLNVGPGDTSKQFECYMPFLCGKTPLVELDLRGCCIGVPNFNKLVDALSQNQPVLKSLFLGSCLVGGNANQGRANLLPFAELSSLTLLDLSNNRLPTAVTVALLEKLSKTPNRLVTLDLGGNSFGTQTFSAMASFLRENNTLRRLAFRPPALHKNLYDTETVLEELVLAVEHNKCLLELELLWSRLPDEHGQRVEDCLDRNRKLAFMDAAMRNAAAFVMPRLLMGSEDQAEFLNRRQLPQEFVQHIIGRGLTEHDALTLSGLNKQTRAAHEEFLRKTGS